MKFFLFIILFLMQNQASASFTPMGYSTSVLKAVTEELNRDEWKAFSVSRIELERKSLGKVFVQLVDDKNQLKKIQFKVNETKCGAPVCSHKAELMRPAK